MATLDFLMTKGMQSVLGQVLLHPDRSFSLSDLIRASGGGHGSTQKIVGSLISAGVLNDRRVGNQRLFRVNPEHPLYPELHSISLKTFGLADRLRDILVTIIDQIDEAFVFGSIAKGTECATSDIDLLVVGDVDYFGIIERLSEAERTLGRPIHLNLVAPAEWAEWQGSKIGTVIANGPRIQVIDQKHMR